MKAYHDLIRHVWHRGAYRKDRTGTGTHSVFGGEFTHDLANGFPLLTTKKMSSKSVIAELCFFMNGYTNISYLHKYGCTIWDEWADENGNLGAVYGAQWRGITTGIDQLANVFHSLKEDPNSRRHVVSAWNVQELDKMALPPCHAFFQFYVSQSNFAPKLHLKMYQRSADLFLGVPYNIASYAALLQFFAVALNYDIGTLTITFGDLHIYKNHLGQCEELLSRDPDKYPLPQLEIKPPYSFIGREVTPDQFVLKGYQSYSAISAPISI